MNGYLAPSKSLFLTILQYLIKPQLEMRAGNGALGTWVLVSTLSPVAGKQAWF